MTISTNDIQVETLLKWKASKEVVTKLGPRLLRKADATPEFWVAWRANKVALKEAGISVTQKFDDPSAYEVCWWQVLPKDVLEERQKSLEASRAVNADIVIPAPAGCEYLPFQKAGIAIAATRPNNLLGDDMGLGKTVQAIGLINYVQDISRVLIVTKASLKLNWLRELKKWLVRPLSIGIADAGCFPTTDIVIINYDICRKFQKRLENFWDLVVCDEAHFLKSRKALRTKSVFGYKPSRKEAAEGILPSSGIPAKRKLLLTGTPFENKPVELYPLLSYLLAEKCMSRSAYEKRFCGANLNGNFWNPNGATHLDELNKWLRETVLIRRLKRDVLKELPPKTRIIVELDPSGAESVVSNEQKVCEKYEHELSTAQVQIEMIKTLESDEEYNLQLKELKKRFYIPFNEISKVRHETALAKLPMAIQALKDDVEESGKKIVVFAHHRDVLEGLAKEFPDSVLITGDTPLDERDRMVQQFQNDPACGPFFGSIRATGEGLTLTAAYLCWFFEEDWVPGKISQCEDRLHRIGQRDNVLVKHGVLKGSMDAKMVTTTVRKQEILDCALDDKKQEMITEPVLVPRHMSLATRKQIKIEASVVTVEQREACLFIIKTFNADRLKLDGSDDDEIGLVDQWLGKALAKKEILTAMEAVLARKICQRYHKLFSFDLKQCGGFTENL